MEEGIHGEGVVLRGRHEEVPGKKLQFGEVLVITDGDEFDIVSEIKPKVLSSDTRYATYIVYKLPQDQSTFKGPLYVTTKNYDRPNTQGQKLDALPRHRSDGWMEVKVWEFKTWNASLSLPKRVSMRLKLQHPVKKDLSPRNIEKGCPMIIVRRGDTKVRQEALQLCQFSEITRPKRPSPIPLKAKSRRCNRPIGPLWHEEIGAGT
ncbi:kinase-like domain, phloem protein 2-like protein [Tanacetum coccineum]